MNNWRQQLIEALESRMLEPYSDELYDMGYDAGLTAAIDIIKSQPEPTGMVVPLDAFVDLMTKLLPDEASGVFDQGVRAARLVAINDAKALAVPAGSERIAEIEAENAELRTAVRFEQCLREQFHNEETAELRRAMRKLADAGLFINNNVDAEAQE